METAVAIMNAAVFSNAVKLPYSLSFTGTSFDQAACLDVSLSGQCWSRCLMVIRVMPQGNLPVDALKKKI